MRPRVSIILAAHDAAARLPGAIRSALDQSLADIEVVVADDASTDDGPARVSEMAMTDPRLRLMRLPVNCGPAGARNAALDAARGDWVAILDADDRFAPDRLETLLATAESVEADVMSDDLALFDEETGAALGPMFGGEPLPETLDACAFLAGSAPDPARPRRGTGFLKPLIRRAFLEARGLRYDPALRFAEDYAFHLRLLMAGARWRTEPAALYRYAVRRDSLTANHGPDDLEKLCAVDRAALAETGDPALRRALRRHLRGTEKRAGWARFIDRAKARDALGLAGMAGRGPHVVGHIATACAIEAASRSRRAAERLLRGDRV